MSRIIDANMQQLDKTIVSIKEQRKSQVHSEFQSHCLITAHTDNMLMIFISSRERVPFFDIYPHPINGYTPGAHICFRLDGRDDIQINNFTW